MRQIILVTVATAVISLLGYVQPSHAATGATVAKAPVGSTSAPAPAARKSMIVKVNKWRRGRGFRRGRGWRRGRGFRRAPYARRWAAPRYRRWKRRRHYGNIIGGIVLGAIIAGAARGAYYPGDDEDVCWYWTSPYRTHGYWDYCY